MIGYMILTLASGYGQDPTIVRHYGTSVLLPLENTDTEKGKILVCGGSPNSAESFY